MIKRWIYNLVFVIFFIGCSDFFQPDYKRYSPIEPIPDNILTIINTHCATSGCHLDGAYSDLTSDIETIKSGASLREIEKGDMPVPGSPQARGFQNNKQALIDFLKE